MQIQKNKSADGHFTGAFEIRWKYGLFLYAQHSLFRGFGDAEFHYCFRWNLNLLAGRRISANSGLSRHEDELSDAGQCE